MVDMICHLARAAALGDRSVLYGKRTVEGRAPALDRQTSHPLHRRVLCDGSVLRTCVHGSAELRGDTSRGGK